MSEDNPESVTAAIRHGDKIEIGPTVYIAMVNTDEPWTRGTGPKAFCINNVTVCHLEEKS